MPRLNELFRIAYGHNYELSRLSQVEGGIPFVSRSSRNNGITAYVDHGCVAARPDPDECPAYAPDSTGADASSSGSSSTG